MPNTIKDIFMIKKHLKFTLYMLLVFSNAIHTLTPNERLFHAAAKSNINAAKKALASGASINARNRWRDTPLHSAIISNAKNDALSFLIARGADVNAQNIYKGTPLHDAAGESHINAMTLLLKHGADTEIQDQYGRTALYKAAQHDYITAITLLLDNGANVNSSTRDGATPLHNAASYNKINVITLLLERGATLEAQDTNDNTPLDFAINYGHVEAAALLLSRGALSIKTPAPWWWNDADLSIEQRLVKHIVSIVQTNTLEEFKIIQADHVQLQPLFEGQSDIVQKTINALYHQALSRTLPSLAGQAFRVIRTAARTQPKTTMPNPNDFSAYYLGDGTELDWLHVSALAKLKARQENKNALPSALEIAPASSLPDDFEAPKRKRDEEEPIASRTRSKKKIIN
jgi:ankyrin repeat protein